MKRIMAYGLVLGVATSTLAGSSFAYDFLAERNCIEALDGQPPQDESIGDLYRRDHDTRRIANVDRFYYGNGYFLSYPTTSDPTFYVFGGVREDVPVTTYRSWLHPVTTAFDEQRWIPQYTFKVLQFRLPGQPVDPWGIQWVALDISHSFPTYLGFELPFEVRRELDDRPAPPNTRLGTIWTSGGPPERTFCGDRSNRERCALPYATLRPSLELSGSLAPEGIAMVRSWLSSILQTQIIARSGFVPRACARFLGQN